MAFVKYLEFIILTTVLHRLVGETPKFRILAPQFVCPKNEDTLIDKPDTTVIALQTDSNDLRVSWIVRWSPLPAPTQRFTLLLWRAVRALEAKLNGPQPEPFVYVINNIELLSGVDYIFNVTELEPNGDMGTTKSFHIDNIKGDQKVIIEGRNDMFSIILIGGQSIFTDLEYVLEADVTTCQPTQDYYVKYLLRGLKHDLEETRAPISGEDICVKLHCAFHITFVWTIHNTESGSTVNVSAIRGSRLEVPSYSLHAGLTYYVNCQMFRDSNGEFITQTGLPFQVLYRGLKVSINVDVLVVTSNSAFTLESIVINHDYFNDIPSFTWQCIYNGESCNSFENPNGEVLTFLSGLASTGKYQIILHVRIHNQIATANCTVISVEPTLPILQIYPIISRTLNENTIISLVANASRVAPTCKLTWYFATEDYLTSDLWNNSICDQCEHGEELSETLTIFSLEENFLNELTDFSNKTEWRLVTTEMQAVAGRARFVAKCECSLTLSCESEGTVYADINFQINNSPKVGEVLVSPDNGTALETMFRISTLAVLDPDRPLRYTFLCRLGINDTLILGSNMEHLAVDTILPYIEGRTEVWVEVCDAFGSCGNGEVRTVHLSASKGRTFDTLINNIRAHIKRCDLMLLQRHAVSAIVTYNNTCEADLLVNFTKALIELLPTCSDRHCIKRNFQYYSSFLNWLSTAGVDTSSLM